MSLQVFADLMSQPARAVAIFCRAASIKHELVNVSRNKIAEVRDFEIYLRFESLLATPRLRSTPR